jgi:protein AbiQ
MPNNLKFYYIDTKYVNYLKETESHIWENDDKGRIRPYIGVVLSINGYKYYAPLSSPKPKHKSWKDSLDFIRIDYKGELKGVINLNNIIPVSEEKYNIG